MLAHWLDAEAGIFRKESITGVYGIRLGDLRGAQDIGDVEIAVRGLGRADADLLISKHGMQGSSVDLRVHGYGFEAQFLGGTDDAQGDLSAVGDQDFRKHGRLTGA